jgi:hypothetical protein
MPDPEVSPHLHTTNKDPNTVQPLSRSEERHFSKYGKLPRRDLLGQQSKVIKSPCNDAFQCIANTKKRNAHTSTRATSL